MAPWVRLPGDGGNGACYWDPETGDKSLDPPQGVDVAWEMQRTSGGKEYYRNRHTRETSWDAPGTVPRAPPRPAAPPQAGGSTHGQGFVAAAHGVADPESGLAVWAEAAAGARRRAGAGPAAAETYTSPPQFKAASGAAQPRWRARQTLEGAFYHVDSLTGQTAWQLPASATDRLKAGCGGADVPGAGMWAAVVCAMRESLRRSGHLGLEFRDGRVLVKMSDPLSGGLLAWPLASLQSRWASGSTSSGSMGIVEASHHLLQQRWLRSVAAACPSESAWGADLGGLPWSGSPLLGVGTRLHGRMAFLTTGSQDLDRSAVRRCLQFGILPVVLDDLDSSLLQEAHETLRSMYTRPQTLLTSDDGNTWRPYLRPRTRAARTAGKPLDRRAAAPRGPRPTAQQERAKDQAKMQAEAKARAQAGATAARSLLLAHARGTALAILGASDLADDTPLLRAGAAPLRLSQPGAGQELLLEPQLDLVLGFEHAQLPRVAAGMLDAEAAPPRAAGRPAPQGLRAHAVKIRGSGASAYGTGVEDEPWASGRAPPPGEPRERSALTEQ